jgi:hypothetical protein
MIFWLKYLKIYTVEEINLYPIGQLGYAVIISVFGLISPLHPLISCIALIMSWWSDATRKRWPPIIIGAVRAFFLGIIQYRLNGVPRYQVLYAPSFSPAPLSIPIFRGDSRSTTWCVRYL